MGKGIAHPVELEESELDSANGGLKSQNNLRQIGLAAHNYESSAHPGGVNVVLGDGSVRGVKDSITR